jgi:hypothetical protein
LLLLKFVNPLSWLKLFATDYLIAFLFFTGVCLLPIPVRMSELHVSKRGFFTAVMSAVFVVTVPGFFVASYVLHMSLSDSRWWRFVFISIAGFPLFVADEFLLRRIQPRLKSEAFALLTRGLLLAVLLTGVLDLNREHMFLVLIAPLIVIFWIALWFSAGVIHRHTTRSPQPFLPRWYKGGHSRPGLSRSDLGKSRINALREAHCEDEGDDVGKVPVIPAPFRAKKCDQFATNLLPNTVRLHQLWCYKNTDEPTS